MWLCATALLVVVAVTNEFLGNLSDAFAVRLTQNPVDSFRCAILRADMNLRLILTRNFLQRIAKVVGT